MPAPMTCIRPTLGRTWEWWEVCAEVQVSGDVLAAAWVPWAITAADTPCVDVLKAWLSSGLSPGAGHRARHPVRATLLRADRPARRGGAPRGEPDVARPMRSLIRAGLIVGLGLNVLCGDAWADGDASAMTGSS